MKLIIVSGLSGSGKSVALHTLEDEGFHCIDNLPIGMLNTFIPQISSSDLNFYNKAALGVDARSGTQELNQFPELIDKLKKSGLDIDVVFLEAETETLIKRFNETRRLHPLSQDNIPLVDAIRLEKNLLAPIASYADLKIDSTQTNLHQLRTLIRERIGDASGLVLSLLFQSFGYKHGVPSDSDFVFDIRCLPNPHWVRALKKLTGRDAPVVEFLEQHTEVKEMYDSVCGFLEQWIPKFQAENRRYLSISIGCTGGQHRSVYLVERLSQHFRQFPKATVSSRHRELSW